MVRITALILLTVFGALLGAVGIKDEQALSNAIDWPLVDVRITGSKLEQIAPGKFRPVIGYEYDVNGKTYTSTNIFLPSILDSVFRSQSETEARRLTNRYPDGSAAQAHFDPENPSEAVLEPEVFIFVKVAMYFGPILFITCAGLLIAELRKK